MALPIPEKILVTKRIQNSLSNFEFFVELQYEYLPKFYNLCGIIGHDWKSYKRRGKGETNIGLQTIFMERKLLNMAMSEWGERGQQRRI